MVLCCEFRTDTAPECQKLSISWVDRSARRCKAPFGIISVRKFPFPELTRFQLLQSFERFFDLARRARHYVTLEPEQQSGEGQDHFIIWFYGGFNKSAFALAKHSSVIARLLIDLSSLYDQSFRYPILEIQSLIWGPTISRTKTCAKPVFARNGPKFSLCA